MDYICGFFDTQGFYYNDQYFPREVALLSKTTCIGLSIDHGLKFSDLSSSDKKQANYNTKYHHGLPFNSKNCGMSVSGMKKTIRDFYETYATNDQFLIACKSKEAEAILRSVRIPRINLENMGATWNAFGFVPRACHLHVEGMDKKCSIAAVNALKEWVKKKIIEFAEKKKIKRIFIKENIPPEERSPKGWDECDWVKEKIIEAEKSKIEKPLIHGPDKPEEPAMAMKHRKNDEGWDECDCPYGLHHIRS